ncbi:MAG: endonuclease [Nitrospira sp.]
MGSLPEEQSQSRYKALIEEIFFKGYRRGGKQFGFEREELETSAKALGIKLPKNLGDVLYSIRYRTPMPEKVLSTQPKGMEWIIEGAGRAKYTFKLVPISRIIPNAQLVKIKIPDSTPEIISAYALSDEQALLAKVRYNRLVDVFLGIASYSLQNHLRTTVKGIGQIEIDEIYVGVDRQGRQFVIPIQAKGGSDQLSTVQNKQDIACCAEKFPGLICRSISTQFIADDLIAMFELALENGDVRIVDERHYKLVPSDQISAVDLKAYSARTS